MAAVAQQDLVEDPVRSTLVTANIWVQGVGYNRPISGGTVTFDDATSATTGELVDIPGWTTPIASPNGAGTTNPADLFSEGIDAMDGTSTMNAFGSWSGQNGGLAMSENPLPLPSGTGPYVLAAQFQGDPLPYIFDLYLNGFRLVPDAQADPADPGGGAWRELTRSYNSIGAGDLRIIVGVPKPLATDPPLTGGRLKIDNITFVPEPSTAMLLLGFGGLGLVRRKRG